MSRFSNSKEINERHTKILATLLKDPNNTVCADCSAKGPRWASSNIGVFICIRCSGIHRSLGTHISKVKSTTLDTWTEDQIEVMKRNGNRRVNSLFEAKLPAGVKPNEHTDNRIAEQFIRSKYEKRAWYSRHAAVEEGEETPTSPDGEGKKKKKKKKDKPTKTQPVVETKQEAPNLAAVRETAENDFLVFEDNKQGIEDLFSFSKPSPSTPFMQQQQQQFQSPAQPSFQEFQQTVTPSAPEGEDMLILSDANEENSKKNAIMASFNQTPPQRPQFGNYFSPPLQGAMPVGYGRGTYGGMPQVPMGFGMQSAPMGRGYPMPPAPAPAAAQMNMGMMNSMVNSFSNLSFGHK